MSAEQLEFLTPLFKNYDAAESYRESANRLASDGDHAGVIRILVEHTRR